MGWRYVLLLLGVLLTATTAAPRSKRNIGVDTTPSSAADLTDSSIVNEVTEATKDQSPTPEPAAEDLDSDHGRQESKNPVVHGLEEGEKLNANHTVICQWGHCWVLKPTRPPKYPNEAAAWVAGHWDIMIIAGIAVFCIFAMVYLLCTDKTVHYTEHAYVRDKKNGIIKSSSSANLKTSNSQGHLNTAFLEDIGIKPDRDPVPILKQPSNSNHLDRKPWKADENPEEREKRRERKKKKKRAKPVQEMNTINTEEHSAASLTHNFASEPSLNPHHMVDTRKVESSSDLVQNQLHHGASFLQIAKPAMPARPVSPAMRRRREQAGLPPSKEIVQPANPVIITSENDRPMFNLDAVSGEDTPPDSPEIPRVMLTNGHHSTGLHVGHSAPVIKPPSVPSIHVEHSEPALLVSDPETHAPTFLEIHKPVMSARPVSPAMRRKKMSTGQAPDVKLESSGSSPVVFETSSTGSSEFYKPPKSPRLDRRSTPVFTLDTTPDDVAPSFLDVRRPNLPGRPVTPTMRRKQKEQEQNVSSVSDGRLNSSHC